MPKYIVVRTCNVGTRENPKMVHRQPNTVLAPAVVDLKATKAVNAQVKAGNLVKEKSE